MTAPDQAGELTAVSRTALGVARIRAAESSRGDALFDDPFAATFVAAMPGTYDEEGTRADPQARVTGARLAVHVILRTRFYDDYLLAATADGIGQVVLVAAGLDARAFRLAWPEGVRLFEIDLPPVMSFKDQVLKGHRPACARVVVPADLTGDWIGELRRGGFDPTVATAWLVEGLLVYLGADDVDRLLDAVTMLSAPGSRLACERGGTPSSLSRTEVTALWKGGLEEGVDAWLCRHGWDAAPHGLGEVASSYGRPLRGETASAFVTATRR